MRLTIRTYVECPLPNVWAGFDQTLFKKLAPPFPPVRVLRFDGCHTGDIVSLELNFLLFKQVWTSDIIDQHTTPDEIYFIDQGTKLPFFLRAWHHKHRLIRQGSGTVIADEITYQTPNRVLDILFFPILWAQFVYRKPIYRQVFNR
jgi:ligand-binding SRPBCC domain-containing protein